MKRENGWEEDEERKEDENRKGGRWVEKVKVKACTDADGRGILAEGADGARWLLIGKGRRARVRKGDMIGVGKPIWDIEGRDVGAEGAVVSDTGEEESADRACIQTLEAVDTIAAAAATAEKHHKSWRVAIAWTVLRSEGIG